MVKGDDTVCDAASVQTPPVSSQFNREVKSKTPTLGQSVTIPLKVPAFGSGLTTTVTVDAELAHGVVPVTL